MAHNGYFHARDEFIDSLAQNGDALEKLQKLYKLPEIYSTLPPERTVRALELMNVFSPQSPVGIVELPFWLGMKETHKKIKRIVRIKKNESFRYRGCNELHDKADLALILSNVQKGGRNFLSELQLVKSVLQTRAAMADKTEQFIKVIPAITDLVTDVENSMKDLANLRITLDGGHENNTDFCFSSKRKVGNDDNHEKPPHALIQPPSIGSDPLKRKPIEQPYQSSPKQTRQPLLPPPNRFEESWRKEGPPSPWNKPRAPKQAPGSPRVIETVANKMEGRKVMIDIGAQPRIRMSRTFDDRATFDQMMAERQDGNHFRDQGRMMRPLPQPVMIYDDILPGSSAPDSHAHLSQSPHQRPLTPHKPSTNPFEMEPLDTQERVIIKQQNPFVQREFSVSMQQQFQTQLNDSQGFPTRQSPSISSERALHPQQQFLDHLHSSRLAPDDYERLRRSRLDHCGSYVEMTGNTNNKTSSYVNIRNGMPVNDIPDSDEETDQGMGSRYYNNFDDDEGDEAGYPKEEYDSFISSNGMSRSHLMQ